MNTLHIEDTESGRRLHMDGEVTVYSAFYFRDTVLAAVPPEGELEVDLSGIRELDLAGLQVMVQLKSKCPRCLRFTNHSRAVQVALNRTKLAKLFSDAEPEEYAHSTYA